MAAAIGVIHQTSGSAGFPLLAAMALAALTGCSTLFDAPSAQGLKEQISARVMSDLATIAAEEALALVPETISMSGFSDETTVAAPKAVPESMHALMATPVHTVGDMTVKRSEPLSDDMLLLDSSVSSPRSMRSGVQSAERRAPTLTFAKIDTDMPQLVIQKMTGAVVSLNGEKIDVEDGKNQRIVLVHPGRHRMKVEYSSGAPFTADFYIEKGERLTLRGS